MMRRRRYKRLGVYRMNIDIDEVIKDIKENMADPSLLRLYLSCGRTESD